MAEYIERKAVLADELTYPLPLSVGKAAGRLVVFAEDIEAIPAADVAPVVRCRDCKHRNKQKCPLVMVRFDMKPNGKIKKVLEQNYVDEEFWCKDGARMDGAE